MTQVINLKLRLINFVYMFSRHPVQTIIDNYAKDGGLDI